MKTKLFCITALACLLALTTIGADESASPAGQIDFGGFEPSDGCTFVEVNIGSGLIRMASKLAAETEAEVAEVLSGLKSVRVNVIGLNDDNRSEIVERMESIRKQLDAEGWERLVTVKEGDENVGIYAKLRSDEAIEGIAITVIEGGNEAVFINVVGDIRPEQLAAVAERLNLEPLEEISKQFGARKQTSTTQ